MQDSACAALAEVDGWSSSVFRGSSGSVTASEGVLLLGKNIKWTMRVIELGAEVKSHRYFLKGFPLLHLRETRFDDRVTDVCMTGKDPISRWVPHDQGQCRGSVAAKSSRYSTFSSISL